jgi:crossover junction endodeoxyribonuclease RuvC
MIILGVDPGSRNLGYGLIEKTGNQMKVIDHGTLELYHKEYKGIPVDETTPSRLKEIFVRLGEVIQQYKPQIMAVEKVFFAKNAVSALKLGQARGVVLLTAAVHDLEIYEYSVTEVKSTLTGHGRADKEQVAKMLTLMMGAKDFATLDASDALALAAAHAMKGADPAGSRSTLGGARKSSKKSGNSLKALAEAKLGKSRQ